MRKFGCKWIDIDYIQPSLDRSKDKVRNLYLLSLPLKVTDRTYVASSILLDFVEDFFCILDEDYENDNDYIKIKDQIRNMSSNGNFYVSNIPYREEPRFCFKRCSVSLHLPFESSNESIQDCRFISSFEDDLLAYYYQKNKPFKSFVINPQESIKVNIIFPNQIKYSSEGRTETISLLEQNIECNLIITNTQFGKNKTVLTLSFNPVSYFTEIDLIKLSCIFGSTQEKSGVKENIKFEIDGQIFPLYDFIANLRLGLRNASEAASDIITGSITLDLMQSTNHTNTGRTHDLRQIIELIHQVRINDYEAYVKLKNLYNDDQLCNYLLNSLCGLVLGIFDYERMGWEEFTDTVKPILSSPDSVIISNRASLVSLSYDDELLEETYCTTGCNPYIVIPNILATHNEFIISLCNKKIETFLSDDNACIEKAESTSEYVNREKNRIYEDVFNYETEKTIYKNLVLSRNLNTQRIIITNLENELQSRLNNLRNSKKDRVDAFITIVLIGITILQLEGNFLRYLVGLFMGSPEITSIERIQVSLIFSLVLLSVLFYRMIRRYLK
ncbi:MAG: hypothetical protein AB7V07_07825 [Candidatus Delongbacteria bacterium]